MNLHDNGCQDSKADKSSNCGLFSFISQYVIPQNLIERQGTVRIPAINMYTASPKSPDPLQTMNCSNLNAVTKSILWAC